MFPGADRSTMASRQTSNEGSLAEGERWHTSGTMRDQPAEGDLRMTVDVHTEIVIDRDIETVATYAADPDNAPAWYVNIKAIEWETEPPPRVGSKMAFVAKFMGRRLAYTYEITEFVPQTRLVMRTAQGPFPMETTYEWVSETDDRTRMTLRNRGTPLSMPGSALRPTGSSPGER